MRMAIFDDVEPSRRSQRGIVMLLTAKPEINLLAGWFFLFSKAYRRETRDHWQTLPAWVMAIQIVVGVCSLVFPLIVIGLLAFVFIGRHL